MAAQTHDDLRTLREMRSLAVPGGGAKRIEQQHARLGPCAGGAVYSPALTDFIIMAGDSTMFLTGPDIRDAITAIFDHGSFLEIQPAFAPNAVVGFVRLDGYSVGVVANQPACMSGALDIDASDKISRFIRIRICDAFNIPLVMRKAMGGAYVAMGSKQMRIDLAFAWPTAQIAVMGAEPAVRLLHRDQFFNPCRAADVGQIDEVIEPRETRPRLARALEVLRTKVQQGPPKKHGLSPT